MSSVNDFSEWRAAARRLLRAGIPPRAVTWLEPTESEALPFDEGTPAERSVDRAVGRVPQRFVQLAQAALCHRDPARFALLYSLLWRLQKDRDLIGARDDAEVGGLHRRVEAVIAAGQRMRQELRFRRSVAADGHKGLRAAYEPAHYVLERVAPYFARQHAHEDWLIVTPYRSAAWDGKVLSYGAGLSVARPGRA